MKFFLAFLKPMSAIKCKSERVVYQNPPVVGVIPPLSQVAIVGNVLYVSGQEGFRPDGTISNDTRERIRQAFRNVKNIAQYYNTNLQNVVRNVVYITGAADSNEFSAVRAIVNEVQAEPEFWGPGPYPPRSILGVRWLANQEVLENPIIVEVESTINLVEKKVPQCVRKCC